ncbi:MAG: NUDIX domain-containing protein [Spirochaetes bacterium]|nr:MAG: NUDIX domain-containing protein [Spirochaetota bacterium]
MIAKHYVAILITITIVILLYYNTDLLLMLGIGSIGFIIGFLSNSTNSGFFSGSNEPTLKDLIKKAGPKKQYGRPGYDEISYGLVPISKDKTKVLITKSKSGFWGFAKGHPDEGESEKATAIRENIEEIGIKVGIDELMEEITMEDNMNISEEQLMKHLKKMIEKGESPHVNSVGLSKRLLVFYPFIDSENQIPEIDNNEVLDSKWCTWEDAEKLMKETKSNQIEILKKAKKLV